MKLNRAAAVLALTAVALTTGCGAAQAAGTGSARVASAHATHTRTTQAAAQASDWLAGQLSDGVMVDARYGSADYGLTAQTVLALRGLGGHDDVVSTSAAALADNAGAFIETPGGEMLAGPIAQLVAVARATGADPRHFGGIDLVADLEQRVSTSSIAAGRLVDGLHYGDTVDTVDQALAVRDLAGLGSAQLPATVSFLLQQQCSDGYFRLRLTDPHTPGQACQDGDGVGSEPDVTATADAVLALRAASSSAPAAQRTAIAAAVRSARAWLLGAQRTDGSFVADPTASSPAGKADAAATGAAAQALAATGRAAAATDAAAWLTRLQLRTGRDSGALAPSRTAYAAGAITASSRPTFRYATAQAAPGLGA